jgi:hypothetical protein
MINSLFGPQPNVTTAYHIDSAGDKYYGKTQKGSDTSHSRWQIVKMEYTGNDWITKYPNGEDAPRFVWDDVESYTYKLLGVS